MGDACSRNLCLFWATLTHMLFAFCHELFLHVVFAAAIDLDSNSLCFNSHFPFCSLLEMSLIFGLFLTVLIGLIRNYYRVEWIANITISQFLKDGHMLLWLCFGQSSCCIGCSLFLFAPLTCWYDHGKSLKV